MADLAIRIKKKSDGLAALSCTRAGGTVTWQRQDEQRGRFFPLHDLTHLAVESVLELSRAFYGLLAEGWDITSFQQPDVQAILPHEALFAELTVGYFDLERSTGNQLTADDVNDRAVAYFANAKRGPASTRITKCCAAAE